MTLNARSQGVRRVRGVGWFLAVLLGMAAMSVGACGSPVVGADCVRGAWVGPRFTCACGSPTLPASTECESSQCEQRLLLFYRQDGTFLEDVVHLDGDSFSTLFGHPPTSGTWSATATALHQDYLDFLEPKEEDRSYTCEDSSMLQRNFKFERLDDNIKRAVQQAAATGDWSDQPF